MAGGFVAYHEPGSKYSSLAELMPHGLTMNFSCPDLDYYLIFLFLVIGRVVLS